MNEQSIRNFNEIKIVREPSVNRQDYNYLSYCIQKITMIKFFRKIRQKLLSENKFGKYLKYAIGEILLVMIGILLALQVNNWNEKRRNKINEQFILNSLHQDFLHNKKKSSSPPLFTCHINHTISFLILFRYVLLTFTRSPLFITTS